MGAGLKGTVYTGIVYLPKHPEADMHGLLRCVVRTQGLTELTSILRIYDIPFSPALFNWGLWCESKSIVEQHATGPHYGRVMVCSLERLELQFLSPEGYRELPDSMKRTAPAAQVLAGFYTNEPAIATITIPIGKHLYAPVGDGDRRCRVCHNFGKDDPIHVKAVFSEEVKQDG